ncbi:hypothetical protein A3Q34_18210 [Colwellia sp. PAMC 20917]|jgi:hypothetical protein|uniref:hypothetical protein n=1 Tax=Colwellia sp. PAMC 20917 TaxID=1816218 RepID=UPI000878229A|nr:hypothetical protein [Colwellia sp. PAMC 20917]AOW78599.1 hypothetical protein A3Q34_18210 [Colwellia sp. PAMC 20917]
MTQAEQKKFILDFVQDWAGSKQAALKWYESEVIPALDKTVQQAVNGGDFDAVKHYLKHIEQGGFA